MALVVVFTSNAVNLTDGLDGLAIGLMVIAAGALTILTYAGGHVQLAQYLQLARNRAHRRADDLLRLDDRAPVSASSGTTRTPRRFSWATSARSASAARWPWSRC